MYILMYIKGKYFWQTAIYVCMYLYMFIYIYIFVCICICICICAYILFILMWSDTHDFAYHSYAFSHCEIGIIIS